MSESSSHGAQGQHSPFLWPFPEPFWMASRDSSMFSGKRGNPLCRLELHVTVAIVRPLSHVWLPMDCSTQASLSFTISWSWLKLMSIELVMPSSHLILCHLLLFLIFTSIRVFSNELPLRIRWPKYCSFRIGLSSEYSGLVFFKIDWLDLLAVEGSLKSLL